MNVREAVTADASALAELAERTFRDTFAGDNASVHMDAHCKASYSPAIQQRELADDQMRTLVVEADDALMAFAQLRKGDPPASVTGVAPIELWRFYVDVGFHGKGVASQLMARVDEVAQSCGARTLWLGVWERNFRAQNFYRKCGFVDAGTHFFMLGSDPQTDLLMRRDLGHTSV